MSTLYMQALQVSSRVKRVHLSIIINGTAYASNPMIMP